MPVTLSATEAVKSRRASISGAQSFSNDQQFLGGIIKGIGGVVKTGIGIATKLIPGEIDDVIARKLFGGSGLPGGGLQPTSCPPFMFWDAARQECVLDLVPGGGGGGVGPVRDARPPGDAAVGRFGVGMEPGLINRAVRVCLEGMQLAKDGLCYNKGAITNAQRAWPKGRKPLLTGGDMRAISTAARASKRLQGTTKRLQKMGMIPKPRPRSQRRIAPPRTPPVTLIGQAID